MAKFTSAVILAAGSGTRFSKKIKKQFADILGEPCIVHTVRAFEACELIDEIILVGDTEALSQIFDKYSFKKIAMIVGGGETRQESALLGFDSVSDRAAYVAVHDGARCLVTPEIIEKTVKAAYKNRAATAGHRSEDTVKLCDSDDMITDTQDRSKTWLVQTPQVFMCDIYRVSAYMAKQDSVAVTDDCMMCERLGFDIKLVECGRENLKLTSPEDLGLCEAILTYRKAQKEASV